MEPTDRSNSPAIMSIATTIAMILNSELAARKIKMLSLLRKRCPGEKTEKTINSSKKIKNTFKDLIFIK
jgi:hypothetical protein